MVNPSYLVRSRHNIFYLRWPIPKELHPLGITTDIKVSLATRNPKKALQLSRLLVYSTTRLIQSLGTRHMNYSEIRALLKTHFSKQLTDWRQKIASSGRLSSEDKSTFECSYRLADAFLESGTTQTSEKDEKALLRRFIAHYDLPITEDSPEYATFREELNRAHRSLCMKVLDYDRSLESYDLDHPTPYTQENEETVSPQITLKELVDKFIAEQVRANRWTPKTKRERDAKLCLLKQILDESTPCSGITIESARHVKDVLCKIPKNINKNPKTREMSLEEALNVQDAQRMNVETVNKYITLYNNLLEWAKINGYVDTSLFHGLLLKKPRRQEASRQPFTAEQLALIFKAVTTNTKKLIKKKYQYWGTLIAMFTGAHLNEIAQIGIDDVKQEDGVWYFDINEDANDSHLKTEAARRRIPIHSKLIELGLLNFIESVRKQGKTRMLHELSYSSGNGYGRKLGRWFNESYLPSLGIKNQGLVFHSFRHTMVTRLLQA